MEKKERKISLRHPYIAVQTENGKSFGGNQQWFPRSYLKNAGCGIVGAADMLLYLKNRRELSKEEYIETASRLWKRCIPVIPGFGVNGLWLTIGMNLCFLKERLPFFASWHFYRGKRTGRMIGQMLDADYPVILAIGPNFPQVWKKERLTFYRKASDGTFFPAAGACAHFVTVTAKEGEKLTISSWGREYVIDFAEYDDYVKKKSSGLVCGLVRLRRIKK